MTVKQPELVIPLAFLSHFALDSIPHYNPAGVNRDTFGNLTKGWGMKFANPYFKYIFFGDMAILSALLVILPFSLTGGASYWTILLSMLAAISPDFVGGRFLIYKWLGIKVKAAKRLDIFTRFHLWFQWLERPWGVWIEIAWFLVLGTIILSL